MSLSEIDLSMLNDNDPCDSGFKRWIDAGIYVGNEYTQNDMLELYSTFRAGYYAAVEAMPKGNRCRYPVNTPKTT